ncbi:hypothetical protein C8R45DRAFT_1124376 [Mycena sanguinolenta]|nr:hypothetical protein C8R45DRAFT_1124376 [Mycena sanguinolenta]
MGAKYSTQFMSPREASTYSESYGKTGFLSLSDGDLDDLDPRYGIPLTSRATWRAPPRASRRACAALHPPWAPRPLVTQSEFEVGPVRRREREGGLDGTMIMSPGVWSGVRRRPASLLSIAPRARSGELRALPDSRCTDCMPSGRAPWSVDDCRQLPSVLSNLQVTFCAVPDLIAPSSQYRSHAASQDLRYSESPLHDRLAEGTLDKRRGQSLAA